MKVQYNTKKITKAAFLLAACAFCLNAAPAAKAQEEKPYQPAYAASTLENFARMYWRLGKLDLRDDHVIDNFLRITECDVFKDYYHNEFQWKQVRASGRNFLKEKSNTFPLRFEFLQPLALGEYDFERKGFHVIKDHKIDSAKRFQIPADDIYEPVCNTNEAIPQYPKVLSIELSRPLDISFVPVPEEQAGALIRQRMEKFKELKEKQQTKENLYALRDTVLIMKVKLFSYQGESKDDYQSGHFAADVLGVLEEIEIYTDQSRKELLYKDSYRRRTTKSKFEEQLIKEHDIKKEKEKTEENKD